MTTTATMAYLTTTIHGQTVCQECITHAATSSEENYFDHLVEQIGRPAAIARANALPYQGWTDTDLAEIDRWALALLDDAYNNGVMCSLHMDETDAHTENDDRDATAEAEDTAATTTPKETPPMPPALALVADTTPTTEPNRDRPCRNTDAHDPHRWKTYTEDKAHRLVVKCPGLPTDTTLARAVNKALTGVPVVAPQEFVIPSADMALRVPGYENADQDDDPATDYASQSRAALRSLAKARGLTQRGTAADLAARLTAADQA